MSCELRNPQCKRSGAVDGTPGVKSCYNLEVLCTTELLQNRVVEQYRIVVSRLMIREEKGFFIIRKIINSKNQPFLKKVKTE